MVQKWMFRLAVVALILGFLGAGLNVVALWWVGLSLAVVATLIYLVVGEWDMIKLQYEVLMDRDHR